MTEPTGTYTERRETVVSGVTINRAVADRLATITLQRGSHTSWAAGHCALEVCSQAAYKVPPEYTPCGRCGQTGTAVFHVV